MSTRRNDRLGRRLARLGLCAGIALLAAACDPEAEALHAPINPDHGEPVTFQGTATDDGTIARIEIRVNGTLVKTCPGPGVCSHTMVPTTAAFDTVRYEVCAVDDDGDEDSAGPYHSPSGGPGAPAGSPRRWCPSA